MDVDGQGEPGPSDAKTITFIDHNDVRQRVIDLDTLQNSINREAPRALRISILRRLFTAAFLRYQLRIQSVNTRSHSVARDRL
jgi:hypothetical protein